jgi:hypothetical protein
MWGGPPCPPREFRAVPSLPQNVLANLPYRAYSLHLGRCIHPRAARAEQSSAARDFVPRTGGNAARLAARGRKIRRGLSGLAYSPQRLFGSQHGMHRQAACATIRVGQASVPDMLRRRQGRLRYSSESSGGGFSRRWAAPASRGRHWWGRHPACQPGPQARCLRHPRMPAPRKTPRALVVLSSRQDKYEAIRNAVRMTVAHLFIGVSTIARAKRTSRLVLAAEY